MDAPESSASSSQNYLYNSVPADIAVIMQFVDLTSHRLLLQEEDVDSEEEVEACLGADDDEIGTQGVTIGLELQKGAAQVGALDNQELLSPINSATPHTPSSNDLKGATSKDSDSDGSLSSDDESDTDSSSSSSLNRRLNSKSHAAMKSQIVTMQAEDDVSLCSDEDGGHNITTLHAPATAHEIVMPEVTMPAIISVDDDDPIEPLGDIFNIIDYVVVVKSGGSRAEKVLDSGSLLVFEDRKVLGEVFETFGPTTQPMYSVRFPSASMIDAELVAIGRKVFHVPTRSFFVFTRGLRAMKGSDASNQYDEEVGESEREFSDDEQESQHRQLLKRRRQNKPADTRFLRVDTSKPSVINDYGDVPFNSDPYEESPSLSPQLDPRSTTHPPPAPYEALNYDEPLHSEISTVSMEDTRGGPRHSDLSSREMTGGNLNGRGSRNGRRPHHDRGRGRGRSEARGPARGRADRGRGRGGRERDRTHQPTARPSVDRNGSFYGESMDEYDPRISGPSVASQSEAFAQSLVQPNEPNPYHANFVQGPFENFNPQAHTYPYYSQQFADVTSLGMNMNMVVPGVVPHINPRFFGAQMGMMGLHTPTQPSFNMHEESNFFAPMSPPLSTPLHFGSLDGSMGGSARSQFSSLPDQEPHDHDFA